LREDNIQISVQKLSSTVDDEVLVQIVSLHKESFDKTIATTLSDKKLLDVYIHILKYNVIKLIVAKIDEDVVGCASYRENTKKYKLNQLIKLSLLSFTGLILHPLTWLKETYYKIGLYNNISSSTHIVTLFVSKRYQNNQIGKKLLDSVVDFFPKNLTVDTRVENIKAIKFYEKNNFVVVRKNLKNVVLIRKKKDF
jgi:ribosomal protein S18 acetylase RimI-like enzyme